MKNLTPVFYISFFLSIIFILWGALTPSHLESVSTSIQTSLQVKFGWLHHFTGGIIILFVISLALSKYGHIKLGKDDDEPEYSTFSWFAMLFSAGMGIGLVFWGVAEPLSHYYDPPIGEAQSLEAAKNALSLTFFHWGLHPWAIYALVALALAYFTFRKNLPGVISASFYPLLGDYVKGPIGIIIDTVAVFATVFGVATSLGFGAIQIIGGIHYLNNDFPNGLNMQIIIISGITILFMISVLSGIGKGMKWISNINIILAILLVLFLLVLGSTSLLLHQFTSSLIRYAEFLPKIIFSLAPLSMKGSKWIHDWTIFYWAWWVAWSPFVGSFIARISKGRTIREFVIGVLAVPTVFCALWFTVLGGTGIHLEMFGTGEIWQATDQGINAEIALFAVLNQMPFQTITSILSIILIGTFFITSADSATYVMGMQTTNGMLNPPKQIKAIWGMVQAAAATVLLWAGGLHALQSAVISSAFPFTLILFFIMISLYKELREENIKI
ncbi:BCCT family transporter [Pseudogracilibacillus sp. SE30717A]|uniref:BCCT family transporter n=1 Tax=Pseudogracilibacillus sp. SE30717A TaxID=3098293 RepID=UPI00300E58FD